MVDGDGLVLCRMYLGGWQVIDGYTKNIIAGHGNSIFFLLLSTLFHLTLFVLPLGWLIAGAALRLLPGWPLCRLRCSFWRLPRGPSPPTPRANASPTPFSCRSRSC